MPRGKPTSDFVKGQVIALHNINYTLRQIAKHVKLPKSTVSDIIKRYRDTKCAGNKPRHGRNKLSTPRQDRSLVRDSLRNRKLTTPLLQNIWKEETGIKASTATVKRRLVAAG